MRCVILDDYEDVAMSYADWSSLDGMEVSSITTHVADPDDLVRAIGRAEVLVVMRERTPLPRALLERLPVDDRLRTHPRVLATPHLGYVTERNYRTYFTEAVDDVAAWVAGQPVRVLT